MRTLVYFENFNCEYFEAETLDFLDFQLQN